MKTATYTDVDGNPFTVEYDDTAPCRICGHPVLEASIGGTDVCPWCDSGSKRPDNLLGRNHVTFKCGNRVKQFQQLFDENPYCNLKIGDVVEIELSGGKTADRKVLNKIWHREYWGMEIEYVIDDGLTKSPSELLEQIINDYATKEIDKNILDTIIKITNKNLNKKINP